jgi:8-oxo-dGTP diphosphatase
VGNPTLDRKAECGKQERQRIQHKETQPYLFVVLCELCAFVSFVINAVSAFCFPLSVINMNPPSIPIIGVSVTIFRDATAQEILLVQRGKEPLKGHWAPPGGRLEWGETVAEAALREVQEECNITIHLPPNPSFSTIDRISHSVEGEILYHFVLVGVVAIAEAGATPQAGDDAAACQWVRVSELATIQPQVDDLEWVIAMAKTRLTM